MHTHTHIHIQTILGFAGITILKLSGTNEFTLFTLLSSQDLMVQIDFWLYSSYSVLNPLGIRSSRNQRRFLLLPFWVLVCVSFIFAFDGMVDMTNSDVWHHPLIFVMWLMYVYDTAHSYELSDSLLCVPWLVYMCVMTHWYVCHDKFV